MITDSKTRRTIEGQSVPAWLIVNIIGVLLGFLLFIVAYTIVGGVFLARPVAQESTKSFFQELTPVQEDDLVKGTIKRSEIESLIVKENDLKFALQARIGEINWLLVLPMMNAVAFAVVGFIVGLLRTFRYVGLIPAALLPITVPMMLNSEFFGSVQNYRIGALVSVFAQFASTYLFAYLGTWLRRPAMKTDVAKV